MKNIVLFCFSLLPLSILSQTIISEDIELNNGTIELPGTLTYPKSEKELPLVIFVHGSGNINRNGNQAGTPIQSNYIKTLADSLNTKEIAVYRYDKRTAMPSNIKKQKDILITDFAKDVQVAIAHFKDDRKFSSIHLIGHSQGSLTAMLAMTEDVYSYISIAGPGQSMDKVIFSQLLKQSEELANISNSHFTELMETDTIQNVNPMLLSLFAPQNQKFVKNWASYNPLTEIKKLKVPVLILAGDADLQVDVKDAKSLYQAYPQSELCIIPKMNHVLKTVNSMEENQKAYIQENVPLSIELVAQIEGFIKKTPIK